jgi:hypothetical protein
MKTKTQKNPVLLSLKKLVSDTLRLELLVLFCTVVAATNNLSRKLPTVAGSHCQKQIFRQVPHNHID